MQTPETPNDQSQAIPLQSGQETVIRFVLNGPSYPERPAGAETAHEAPPQDVTDLRQRVAVLERTLVDAETPHEAPPQDVTDLRQRVAVLECALVDAEAQLQALARAIGAVFPASANFVDRSARPAPAPPAPGHNGAWTTGEPSTSASSGERGGSLTAAAAAASSRYREPEPLSIAAAPEPPPPGGPTAPKVNGLRRMISVLKHNG